MFRNLSLSTFQEIYGLTGNFTTFSEIIYFLPLNFLFERDYKIAMNIMIEFVFIRSK